MRTNAEILQDWKTRERHLNSHLIEDGIIDQDAWDSSSIKILFLLKEAYGTIDDLTNHLQYHCRFNKGTWKRSAEWAHLVLSKDARRYEEISVDEEAKKQAMLSCAVVNIKKSGGHTSSDMVDIETYADKDSDLLREQISVIQPDLIISGGVFDCWWKIWEEESIKKMEHRIWCVDGITAINFCHPASVYPEDFMYFSMMKLVKDARDLKLIPVPKA